MNSKQRKSKRTQLTHKFGSHCFWSGRCLLTEELTLDHLIPKSRGGSNSLENLRLACFSCNNSRGDSLFPPRQSCK
ncbi:HNH endonuclease [Phormidesmis priestleyi ULC007]|uniref:HNH endonuclease n=1 Tax=Phormidesmis priestleyi ULC007 TaxID=1920490 RepID=A0A2T1DJE7_9CYAN|nr:HNH endonuclease signature motif containing protein [Phormidesmis priestleyi]PSB20575.1 HNH endonuclease [Phormidesmis priestleyi ULC007]PZO54245.1 MAG: HNH endonuclease [Phormidesmis priestleyi]